MTQQIAQMQVRPAGFGVHFTSCIAPCGGETPSRGGRASDSAYAGNFEARTSAVSSRGALANSSAADAISAAAMGPCRCA